MRDNKIFNSDMASAWNITNRGNQKYDDAGRVFRVD